jgi:AraC-like DNA-binding protein
MLPDLHYYLPVNDDAMRWGIYLTGIGRCTVPPGSAYPPSAHPRLYNFLWDQGRVLPEFAVLLLNAGKGLFESKTTGQIIVTAPGVLFLLPGVWHRYRPMREIGWTERWFCFNGELAHRLMEMPLRLHESPFRQVADPAQLVGSFDNLIQKVFVNPSGNSVLLSLHALGLLGTVIETAAGAELPSALEPSVRRDLTDDALVSRAVARIWTRGHQAISVEQVAEATGVGRRTLERRFQQSIGHSIVEEIINCRMNRAKRLLEETELPVKVVAYLSGFPSTERMRVAFVRREQISPGRYRRRARQGPISGRRSG